MKQAVLQWLAVKCKFIRALVRLQTKGWKVYVKEFDGPLGSK